MSTTETIEVSHTRVVSGASKFILSALPYRAFAIDVVAERNETPEATTIMTRIMKIQTRSFTWMSGSATARTMNEMRATPVTP